MRLTLTFAIACSLLASVCSAQGLNSFPRAVITKVGSVSELRQLKNSAVQIKIIPMTPTMRDIAAGAGPLTGSPVYTTGQGLVLTASRLADSATGSSMQVYCINMYHEAMTKLLQNAPDAVLPISVPPGLQTTKVRLFDAWFYDLPPGEHTYTLTLKLQTGFLKDHFRLNVGGQELTDKLVTNNTTGESRVTFTCTIGGDTGIKSFGAIGTWVNPDPVGSFFMTFGYLQLVQLD